MIKIALLVGACAFAQAIEFHGTYGGQENEDYQTDPHYAYEYSVHDSHTGDIHSQKEERRGDSTHGEYSLVEADGSHRTVQYHVEGKSGFLAEVQRGHGQYSAGPQRQQPAYHIGAAQVQSYPVRPDYSQSTRHQGSTSYRTVAAARQPTPVYRHSAASYPQSPATYYQSSPSYNQPAPAYNQYAVTYHQSVPSYLQSATRYQEAAPAFYQAVPPAHQQGSTYQPSYGASGLATSSVSFSTKGAKITTSTKHLPQPRHKLHY